MLRAFDDLPAPVQAAAVMAVAAGLAASVFFLGLPGLSESTWSLHVKRDLLENQVQVFGTEIRSLESVKQKLPEYLEQIAQLKTQMETLGAILPDEPETEQFWTTLHKLAKASGVQVRTFEPLAPVRHDYYTELRYAIEVEGPYHALLNFFTGLWKLERLVGMSNTSLGPPAGARTENFEIRPNQNLRVSFVVATYSKNPPPTLTLYRFAP